MPGQMQLYVDHTVSNGSDYKLFHTLVTHLKDRQHIWVYLYT